MKHKWAFGLLLLCNFFPLRAQDGDSIALPNTVWQMKYGASAENRANAISQISPESWPTAGNSFLAGSLYGIVPGALIQQTGFLPGTPPLVHIRGNHSPSSAILSQTSDRYSMFTNEPVYLLDGMQVDALWFGGLNPDEIESAEVIRNLAGTVGYGQRGINGVIQIKTKRPQKRGTSLIYNGSWGWQKPTNAARPMNGAEWAEYTREARRNMFVPEYRSPVPSLDEDQRVSAFYDHDVWESLQMGYDSNGNYHPGKVRSTDWVDLVSQTGSIQEQALTLLHGTEKLRLTATGNYFSNSGTVKRTGYDRYSARLLLEGDLTRWFSTGAQLWAGYTERKLKGNMYYQAYRTNPLTVPYDENGDLFEAVYRHQIANPLLYLDKYKDITGSYMLSGRLYAAFRPVEGLNVGLAYLPQVMNTLQRIGDTRNPNDRMYRDNSSMNDTRNISGWEFSVSYQKKIRRHLLGASVSGNFRKDRYDFDYMRIISRDGNQNTAGSYSEVEAKYKYYLLELFYQWNGHLFVNLTGRFGKEDLSLTDEKPSNFNPAVAVAYNIFGKEGLSGPVLNRLNLRATYGKDNNIQLVSKIIFSPMGFTTINFPSKNSYSEWNVGIDHAWLQNRLSGSIDAYSRKNRVQAISFIIENSTYVTSDFMDMKNTGVEITLSGINVSTGQWRWVSSLTASFEKERIALPSGIERYNENVIDGQPLYSYYDFRYGGLWQDTPEDRTLMEKYDPWLRPGDVKIVNTNGDERLGSDDRTVLGSPSPKWYGSLYNSVSYRGLELSFLWYTRQKFTLDTEYTDHDRTTDRENLMAIDYWTPSNTGAHYPSPSGSSNFYSSALRYEDASFVRLQYVSLAWSLPQRWISPLRISRLKIYATVHNPVLLTGYSQPDPEGAATVGSVPGNTTWLLGIRVEL